MLVQGEIGREMYFLITGEIRFIKDGRSTGKMSAPDFFGELGVLRGTKRAVSVQTVTRCDLFFLTKRDWDELTKKFPQLKRNMSAVRAIVSRWGLAQEETRKGNATQLKFAADMDSAQLKKTAFSGWIVYMGRRQEHRKLGQKRNGTGTSAKSLPAADRE